MSAFSWTISVKNISIHGSGQVSDERRLLPKNLALMAETLVSWPSISGNQFLGEYGGCTRRNYRNQQHLECVVRAFGSRPLSDSSVFQGVNFCRFGVSCLRGQTLSLSLLSGQNRVRWHTMYQAKQIPLARTIKAFSDPELHFVLQLASGAELQELSSILYGRSLLSPLVKSLAVADGSSKHNLGEFLTEQDERDALLSRLESRFLFLAADAKSTLSGRRPTYRNVLLQVRKKLNVPCSTELSTEDLESEIFLYLLRQSSGKSTAGGLAPQKSGRNFSVSGETYTEAKTWRNVLPTIMKLRGKEMLSTILKGGSAVTVSTVQRLVFRKLSKKVLVETAKYQLAKEAVVKTGQAAAMLETRVAVLAAKQGLMGAAKRYLTMTRAMSVLGPMLWGTLLAEMLISSVGTDYARVVRAICAFAQIRLMRTYHSEDTEDYF